MYKNHYKCRACGGNDLTPVFDLGAQPLANDFVLHGGEHQGYAPLKVLFCNDCTLAQLSVVVNPEVLYAHNYHYVTSKSQTMTDHFNMLWQTINVNCNPERIIEIGSNDGTFLRYALDHGAKEVLGIDPAENLRDAADDNGALTILGTFNSHTSDAALKAIPDPDLVVARHVFCHVDDWRAFINELDIICKQKTLVLIEVPYVKDMLDRVEFDTIYHEHLSFMSLHAMNALLKDSPFAIHKVVFYPIHGGSVAILLKRKDAHPAGEWLEEMVTAEQWGNFSVHANRNIARMTDMAYAARKDGCRNVCGFGASAKSTVWMNACGFDNNVIDCIVDETKSKQRCFSPGTNVPILPEHQLQNYDTAIMFAWNYENFVLGKTMPWRVKGGKFIIPGKDLRIA